MTHLCQFYLLITFLRILVKDCLSIPKDDERSFMDILLNRSGLSFINVKYLCSAFLKRNPSILLR